MLPSVLGVDVLCSALLVFLLSGWAPSATRASPSSCFDVLNVPAGVCRLRYAPRDDLAQGGARPAQAARCGFVLPGSWDDASMDVDQR
jgi:hypothetical protein